MRCEARRRNAAPLRRTGRREDESCAARRFSRRDLSMSTRYKEAWTSPAARNSVCHRGAAGNNNCRRAETPSRFRWGILYRRRFRSMSRIARRRHSYTNGSNDSLFRSRIQTRRLFPDARSPATARNLDGQSQTGLCRIRSSAACPCPLPGPSGRSLWSPWLLTDQAVLFKSQAVLDLLASGRRVHTR